MVLLYLFPGIALWLPAVLYDWKSSAVQLAADLAAGKVKALEVTEACLARVAADEPRVQAFAHLDPDHARAQARALDERKRAGLPLGRSRTGCRSRSRTSLTPRACPPRTAASSTCRPPASSTTRRSSPGSCAAGAVLLGKTVTTEFACFAPGKTRNPHDPGPHPRRLLQRLGRRGGRRDGAARGGQPDQRLGDPPGLVLRRVRLQAHPRPDPAHRRARDLRHARPPAFARSIEDLALLAEPLMGFDPGDPATRPLPPLPLRHVAMEPPPVPPRLARPGLTCTRPSPRPGRPSPSWPVLWASGWWPPTCPSPSPIPPPCTAPSGRARARLPPRRRARARPRSAEPPAARAAGCRPRPRPATSSLDTRRRR